MQILTNYAPALRTDFTPARPFQPVFMFDGTGVGIGCPITCNHAELGCADFLPNKEGVCGSKQSRRTLQPVSLIRGTDHAPDLRANWEDVIYPSYNRLCHVGSLSLEDDREVPVRPLLAAETCRE